MHWCNASHFKMLFWSVLAISAGFFLASLISGSKITSVVRSEPNTLEPKPELVPTELKEGPAYLIRRDAVVPKIVAKAYLVGDIESGEIIISKDEEAVLPIASLSKLMTALVSVSRYDQSLVTTASRRAVATYGASGLLRTGERLSLGTLLYPLLLESSNDAAEVIAEAADRAGFIREMNAMAASVGMTHTSYAEPSGLSPENRSTARDLFALTSYIARNQAEIFRITEHRKYASGAHTWYNISQFMREAGYAGSKSGYTDEARQTNVALFSLPLESGETKQLAIIVLGTGNRYNDTKALLNFVKQNVYYGDEDSYPFAKRADAAIKIPDDEIELAFVGDVMLDRGIRKVADNYFGGNYREFFRNAPDLKLADIAFANLEGPISDVGTDQGSIYSFRMSPEALTALTDAGFDALSFANNHVGDWGREAFEDTITRLKTAGIVSVGAEANFAAVTEPKIIEKKGIKVGFLGFTDVGPNWLAATANRAGVLLASDPGFEDIVRDAAAKVDALVVSFHWGEEYITEHNERQEMLAHKAIDAGATLIIGHHPHVAQDTEAYKDGYIAYSLGNFIFDQAFSHDTRSGLMLTVRLKQGEIMHVAKKTVTFNERTFVPEEISEE